MFYSFLVPSLLYTLTFVTHVLSATSFAGANLYYAAGLSSNQQTTLFSAMQDASMKVLRVWLDGESTATTKNTPITTYPDLETTIGDYDDTVLNLLDQVMVNAHSYGIKLLISMHSWNALSSPDIYGQTYTEQGFYQYSNATEAFDKRLRYILNYQSTTLNAPWKELSDYIFAFEAENEAMIGLGQNFIEDNQSWQCDRASTIKGVLGDNSGILVTTGGESWLSESVQPGFLSCSSLDVVAIHAYGAGDLVTSSLQPYVTQALNAGKKLLFQEWGACYYDSENNVCSSTSPLTTAERNQNIADFAGNITAAGIPWLYWEALPNPDPHYGDDYEIGVQDPSWPTLAQAAQLAAQATAAFDFSEYLL